MRNVLGVVVTGGRSVLADLGVAGDAALTPFAGKYRFLDFALATLAAAEVRTIHVVAPRPGAALRVHVVAAARVLGALRGPLPLRLATPGDRASRGARTLAGVVRLRPVVHARRPEAVIALAADHVLRLDGAALVETHRRSGADVTLCTLTMPADAVPGRPAVRVTADGRVVGARAERASGLVSVWTGDVVVAGDALATLATIPHADLDVIDALASRLRVVAHEVDGFYHDPDTLEAYYDAQMDLCTPRPALDLYDPRWPVRAVPSALGPAKVVGDAAGRAGQALNSLVSDGAVVRGGVVVNTILGHGVVVEPGAEVEDSVVLDGARVGRGARVRRAVVGMGAVIGDAGEIGFERSPAPPARLFASGLTIVPPAGDDALALPLAAVAGAR
jgi:glucose-1-phosphate adenylyltransferase